MSIFGVRVCAHVWVGGGACAWGCGRAQQDPQAQKVGEYLKLVAAQHRALRLLVSRYLVPGISLLPAWLAGRQKRPGGGGYEHTAQAVRKCWCTRVGTHVLMLSGAAARQKVEARGDKALNAPCCASAALCPGTR